MSYLSFSGAAAAPSFVNHGGLTEENDNSIDVAYPTLAANDILLLHTTKDDTSQANTTITVPVGWTAVSDTLYYGGYSRIAVYWKRATGSETGSITVTASNTGPTDSLCGIISAWRGCKTSGDPFEAVNINAVSGANPGPAVSPGCTTLGPNRVVLKFLHLTGNLSKTPGPVTPGGGFTEVYDLNGILGTSDPRLECSYLEKAGAGSVASDNTTLTTTGGWAVLQFALIPA